MRENIVSLNRNLLAITLWTAIAVMLTACPSTPVNNRPASNNSHIPESTPSPTEAPPATPSETNSVIGSLATPTDAYRTAHSLEGKERRSGDEACISKEILEFFTEMGNSCKRNPSTKCFLSYAKNHRPQPPKPEMKRSPATARSSSTRKSTANGRKWTL